MTVNRSHCHGAKVTVHRPPL